MNKVLFILAWAVVLFSACARDEQGLDIDRLLDQVLVDKSKYILPNSDDLADIPQTQANPLTKEKVDLGKLLFYETAFSVRPANKAMMQTYSCSTCHVPKSGFKPGSIQGIADGAYGYGLQGEGREKSSLYSGNDVDAQGNRPLSLLNVAYVTNSMWNGSFGAEGVNKGTEDVWGKYLPSTVLNRLNYGPFENQNIDGLDVHRMSYTKELIVQNGYKEMFDKAFPEMDDSTRYGAVAASFALSAYIRTLTTTEAPFQLWLRGNSRAMSAEMKEGALLFFGRVGCGKCHTEKNLGANTFHALGVNDLWERGGFRTSADDRRTLGRGGFTGKESDMFKFRVPGLYNQGDSGPYFHGSSKNTLEEVIDYFDKGIAENKRVPESQLSYFIKPLKLTNDEKYKLLVFLRDGLRDPNLNRFVPGSVKSGHCFPNNDSISRIDMNCF